MEKQTKDISLFLSTKAFLLSLQSLKIHMVQGKERGKEKERQDVYLWQLRLALNT